MTAVHATNWEDHSLRARAAFWEEAKPRLARLANRLGPDLKRIRMTVHARIPWPKEPERAKLPLFEARRGYELTAHLIEGHEKDVARHEKAIEAANKHLRNLREVALAREVANAGEALRRLKQAPIG